jgi:endoglucanase
MRALFLLFPLAACSQFRPPDTQSVNSGAPAGDACAIEDAEDSDDRILVRAGRGGYLYTYRDEHGTKISPSGEFSVTRGGANGSRYSLRMTGTVADAAEVYAGMGLAFREPKAPYDASRHSGISFVAKRASGVAAAVRVKLPDVNTDPDGGVCKECFNDFGIDFQVTEEWTNYEVSFADLEQQVGWGEPRPSALDASKLYGLQWQVTTRGADFDLWIDDVRFVGCDEAS